MDKIVETGEVPFLVKDPEAFARNLALLAEEGGKALAAILEAPQDGRASGLFAAEMNSAAKTIGEITQKLMADPQRAVQAHTRLWAGYFELWTRSLRRMAGEDVGPVIAPEPSDRRFRDAAWSEHPMFDFLKQAYLLTAQWAEDLVKETEGIDDHTRQKALFYIRQIAAALSPSNFVLTNPQLLRETVESNGANLVRGMSMLVEDIKLGKGELKIRQSDPTQFEIGKNLALSPGKVIYQNDLMQLIQYAPASETVLKRPLLIVPPWINKFYVLDLTPEKSLIGWAVRQGHTVFVISWVNPDARLAQKSFEHYMREGIFEALEAIRTQTGERVVNALGYCVGGTLLAVTLAYMAAQEDDRIGSATFLTTQVDFTHAGDLKVFVDEDQIRAVEEEMERRGYLAGERMAMAFNLLRSNDLIWPYFVNNYLRGREPFAFDLLFWNADCTRMPAANHSFYLRNCYLDNCLTGGTMEIAGARLDLGKVTVPIYNLATREDHIAPPQSVFLGSQFFGGPVRYVLAGSGHIAGVINPPEKNKYQYWTGPKPSGEFAEWLKKAKEHPGSWWPDWQRWAERLDKKRVPARDPQKGPLEPIEDAPGSYVRVPA